MLDDIGVENINDLWIRGGFPRSYLSDSEEDSILWRNNFITTFLERDIPQLGIKIPANTLRRFWSMISYFHGQIINYSELSRSFGISDMTVRKYIDILESTFMLRVLHPWYNNTRKRLVKRPKIYIRDSGIFHSLMYINDIEQLRSHNKLGASWEGFAIECFCQLLGKRSEEVYFWNTNSGAELDLFWQDRGKNFGSEFKYSDAPKISKSMRIAIDDLELDHLWVIYPEKEKYSLSDNITMLPIKELDAIN